MTEKIPFQHLTDGPTKSFSIKRSVTDTRLIDKIKQFCAVFDTKSLGHQHFSSWVLFSFVEIFG